MVGAAIARSTRSGVFVGPGICRKWRPGRAIVAHPIAESRPSIITRPMIALELQDLDGDVRFDAVSRALYSTDASVYQMQPVGVVLPKSRDDLVRIVAACRRQRCAMTMRGGGTSQAGQAIGHGL